MIAIVSSIIKPVPIFYVLRDLFLGGYSNPDIFNNTEHGSIYISIVFYALVYSLINLKKESSHKQHFLYFLYYLLIYQLFEILFTQYISYYVNHYILYSLWGLLLADYFFREKTLEFNIHKRYLYLYIAVLVFIKSPPLNFVRMSSEWMKFAGGVKGIFNYRDPMSSIVTPNSPRTFLFEFIFGGMYELLGDKVSFLVSRGFAIALISYAVIKLLSSLGLNLYQSILAVSLFFVQQDILGGNGVVGHIEEGVVALSFVLLGLSAWLDNDYRKLRTYLVIACYLHIQFGIYWVGILFVIDFYTKTLTNKKLYYYIESIFFLLPLLLFTAVQVRLSGDPIVYAFNKKASWVYSYIYQRFHLTPFAIDDLETPDWILRNWANGFSRLIFWIICCIVLLWVSENKQVNGLHLSFLIYFPLAVLLSYLDTLLESPGQITVLFLFRQDTVYNLILIGLLIKQLQINIPKSSVASICIALIMLFGLTSKYNFQYKKWVETDSQVQKTYEFLNEREYKYLLYPNFHDYTLGGIELQTNTVSFVNVRHSANDLLTFPVWYERVELRGRFYSGDCVAVKHLPFEIFIAPSEHLSKKCGALIFENDPYSVFEIVTNKSFVLPIFNGACPHTTEEALSILSKLINETNLSIEIEVIQEKGPENCKGKVWGSNLPQGANVDSEIDKIVLITGDD